MVTEDMGHAVWVKFLRRFKRLGQIERPILLGGHFNTWQVLKFWDIRRMSLFTIPVLTGGAVWKPCWIGGSGHPGYGQPKTRMASVATRAATQKNGLGVPLSGFS
ncbi:hypothetical protein [Burkholderia contaminans]|uniref:hypothetical protein n=1 Tax=Burkholderia contaminans TaxID=488447 RepID=UPI002D7E161C|nr:hypothetical protein [Burkholderia contaminans]